MKTKINTISLLILTVMFAVSASWSADLLYDAGVYYVNLPVNGDDALTLNGSIGTFKIYDNGGSSNWCTGQNKVYFTMTAPDGYVFQVTGTFMGRSGYGSSGDLGLYDGDKTKTDSPLFYQDDVTGYNNGPNNPIDVGFVRSTGRVMTIYNRCYNHNLELDVSLLNTAVTHTVTPATVTGGSATITTGNDASVNTTVSVELQPSTGYYPVAVNVTSSDNSPVDVNMLSSFDYTVTFTMPYGNVSVTPTFTDVLTASGGIFVNMPSSDSKTYSIPTGVSSLNLYDHGGAANYISEDHNAIVVLNAPEGKIMKITGLVTTDTYTGGRLILYKGDATSADQTSYSPIQQIEFDDYQKNDYDVGVVYINSNTVSVKYVTTYSKYNNQDLALTVDLLDGSVTHDVPAEIAVTGGTISSDLDKAVIGETVTLTVTPEEKYVLGAIEIVANGEKVSFTKPVTDPNPGAEEQISFEMPYGDVTITPVFTNPKIATFDSDGGLDNYTYFHMECDQNTYVCTVSQGVAFDRYRNDDRPENWKDFKFWYRNEISKTSSICPSDCRVGSWTEPCDCEFGLLDVYKNFYKGYSIKLAGDLYLGGNNGGQCALQFEPFEDDANRQGNVLELDGDGHVIDGLCQTSVTRAGFVYAGNQPLSVSKVTFTNAYISSDGFTGAGVIAAEAAAGVTISDVKVENSTVHGSTNIGGLVGYAAGTISIQNVSFGGTVSGKGPNTIVGGLVGFTMPSNMIIEKSFVDGDVINPSAQVTPNGSLTNNRVGGLVGAVAGGQIDLTIKNTYSIGEIISATYTSSTDSVGYIVGSISAGLSNASRIVNNYHFGDDDVELGVGGIYNVSGYDADTWKQGVSGICYGNVRNSTSSINATGTMGYHRNDTYDVSAQDKTFVDFFAGSVGTSDPVDRTANGVASEADMKSGLLAALMNYNQEVEGEPGLWVSDGDLPVFAGTSDKPNHLVVVQTKQITDAQKIIDGGLEPVQEKYSKDNNGAISHSILASGLTAYTDASGVLNPNAMSMIAAVKAAVADNAGVEAEDVAIVDATGKVVSLTDEFASSQVYSTLVNYTVSFDLSSLDSKTVVLGGDWAASKSGMNVETNKNLPRVYVMAQSGTKMLYSRALWGSALAATTPNARTSEYLSSSLLEEINPTSSKIKLYPVENRVANEATELKVVAFDAGGNALTNDTDYHGSVVLSQVVGDGIDDLKQASSLCPISGNATTAYTHCLYLPNAADTLAFKVSLEPEDGYAMELTEFNFDWMEPTGTVGVAPAGYGYEASTGKLLISLPYMANTDMTFKVKYTVTGPFYVTYNMNINTGDEDKLFFPTDASSAGKFEFSETLVSTDLWVPYRSDKCSGRSGNGTAQDDDARC